jgi:hypothetical protein
MTEDRAEHNGRITTITVRWAERFAVELKVAPGSPVRNARVLHFNELVEEVSDSTEKGFQHGGLLPLSPVSRNSKCVFVVRIGVRRFFRL